MRGSDGSTQRFHESESKWLRSLSLQDVKCLCKFSLSDLAERQYWDQYQGA